MDHISAIFWICVVLLLLNAADFIMGIVFNPEIEDEFEKLKTSIVKSDIGTMGSTAKHKRKVDTIIGQGIMQNIPLMNLLGEVFPELPDFLGSHEHMAGYSLQAITAVIKPIHEKFRDKIPPTFKPLFDMLMGVAPEQ